MESVDATITNYTWTVKVTGIKQHKQHVSTIKNQDGDIVGTYDDCGWFILLDGSQEWLHIGYDEPSIRVGNTVKVTIEKLND